MRWHAALIAKVFRCLDESNSKELLPKTIDSDAGGQRMLRVDEPISQVHPRGSFAGCFQWRQEAWRASRNLSSWCVILTPLKNKSRSELIAFLHHHRPRDGLIKAGLFLLQSF